MPDDDHEKDCCCGDMNLPSLDAAVRSALLYADLFDYPLTAAELHRYLEYPIPFPHLETHLNALVPTADWLARHGAFYCLARREGLVAIRNERTAVAAHLWPTAVDYGRRLAALPFVRLVAVTGSLAVGNTDHTADIDYLLVTANDRLWLCRALVIGMVRWAARRGVTLCPNYFLAERALALPEQNLYVARELAQMVPLAGAACYAQLRAQNRWTADFLPNATAAPLPPVPIPPPSRPLPLLEPLLASKVGQPLEQWERTRKIRKFTTGRPSTAEAAFGPDWCKGHFDGHLARVVQELEGRSGAGKQEMG